MSLHSVASVVVTQSDPELAFYSLHTRAWEMLAGGLVYLWQQNGSVDTRLRNMMEAVGFALIIAAVYTSHDVQTWPGWRAIVPTFGAVLVLLASRASSIWTGGLLWQATGTVSYSLYLWHWPIVTALTYFGLVQKVEWVIAGLLLSVILSAISFVFVESATKHMRSFRSRPVAAIALSALIGVPLVAGAYVRVTAGAPGRIPMDVERASQVILAEKLNRNSRFGECHLSGLGRAAECRYGGPNVGLIVTGDSHAASVIRAVERALPSSDKHVLDLTTSGCPTLAGVEWLPQEGTREAKNFRCVEFLSGSL
ncbi:MAG: SGNH hydrolase domain-containing protein [Hyphomicrobiaceae bacterium]